MTPFKEGLYDAEKISETGKIGDETVLKSTLIRKKDCVAEYEDGTAQNVVLTIKVMPELQYNLISALQAFDNKFKIDGGKDCLSLVKGQNQNSF